MRGLDPDEYELLAVFTGQQSSPIQDPTDRQINAARRLVLLGRARIARCAGCGDEHFIATPADREAFRIATLIRTTPSPA